MKKFILLSAFIVVISTANAQRIKETFNSNSLGWTEFPKIDDYGSAIIENGVLKISADDDRFVVASCYVPIDIMKPFEVQANVTVKKFTDYNLAGIVFNYKDNGNFYSFGFDEDYAVFRRYEDNKLVGYIYQATNWRKKRKVDINISLISDGNTLTFKIDGATIMNIRYMPLSYNGFGFYATNEQQLMVNDVEFIQ